MKRMIHLILVFVFLSVSASFANEGGMIKSRTLSLSPICTPCEGVEGCKQGRRNCNLIVQAMSLSSTDKIALSGACRPSTVDEKCGGVYGGYIFEGQAIVAPDSENP